MCCHTEKRKKTSSAQRDSDQWFILWNRLSQLTSVCSGTSLSLERYHNTNRLIFALSKEVLYSLNHLSGNCLPAVSSLIPHFFFVFFFVISCVLFGLKIFFGDRWFEPVYKCLPFGMLCCFQTVLHVTSCLSDNSYITQSKWAISLCNGSLIWLRISKQQEQSTNIHSGSTVCCDYSVQCISVHKKVHCDIRWLCLDWILTKIHQTSSGKNCTIADDWRV